MLGRGEQHDATGLTDAERGLHVLREEQPLDGQEVRLVRREELVDERVDRQESLRQRDIRRRLETAVVDLADTASGRLDDAVAQRGRPRVDAQDDHPATSAKTSSGMSKLAVTRETSSRSSSSSTRRSAWRAFAASSSTVCLAIIADSADSTGTPADFEGLADGLQLARRRVDLDRLVAVGVDVLGAGIDGGQRDLVGVDRAGARDGDQAARLELPGDRAAARQLPTATW